MIWGNVGLFISIFNFDFIFYLHYRISNLSVVTETVTEFDIVKVPLQEWCVAQQEGNPLPLLETDLQELKKQKEKFQKILSEILLHEEAVETLENLSASFIKYKEVC